MSGSSLVTLAFMTAACGALGVSACASGAAKGTAGAEADRARVVGELRAENARYAQRIAELQNRVVVLETELAARRALTAPTVGPTGGPIAGPPVKTSGVPPSVIAAPPAAGGERTTSQSDARSDTGSLLAEEEVEYAEDAAKPVSARRRPILRLTKTVPGQGRPATSTDGTGSNPRNVVPTVKP